MAFHQPTLPPRRISTVRTSESHDQYATPSQSIDLSQQWVVFSPVQHEAAPSSAARTAGLSRLSDFGSLNTIPRSIQEDTGLSDVTEDVDELDSLDDGLNAFQEPLELLRHPDQSGGAVLPAHDGLGIFPPSSSAVQEQMWGLGKYNSRRRHHSQPAVTSDRENVNETPAIDQARLERIEKWRLDQSRILLEAFEQEHLADETTCLKSVEHIRSPTKGIDQGDFQDISTAAEGQFHSIWQQITQRLRELIGIDDLLLSIILGDSLAPEDYLHESLDAENCSLALTDRIKAEDGWDDSILRRLTRELRVILHRVTSYTVLKPPLIDSSIMEYAGIPFSQQIEEPDVPSIKDNANGTLHFTPTLEAQLREPLVHGMTNQRQDDQREGAPSPSTAEVQYWEQTPDFKTLFGYLARRFMSRPRPSSIASSTNIATINTADSVRRAAFIRQQHPLVARPRLHERHRRINRASQYVGGPSTSLKRVGASCASLSTKRSRRDTSDGASRNYWDLGGSMGSESFSLGGVGAWGEV